MYFKSRINRKCFNPTNWKWELSSLILISIITVNYYSQASVVQAMQSQNSIPAHFDENICVQSKIAFSTKQNIIIKVPTQTLHLCSEAQLVKSYIISTSKYGIGSQANSNKTPLGLHYIKNKIGDDAPLGMIFKARQATGKIAKMNQINAGDLVTTRIMWLKGKEAGLNKGKGIDSYKRYIYIHGTAEENKIGQPASHGCIRMYNEDVIDLFNLVTEGVEVYIEE
ncbi:MAG: L,D-transpeptidase [Thiomargarita sp.]|nr:L,D-transpeptidase [Bacteroidales bacterium]MCK5720109.1 L,D-transpeptidase [Thiomargarita sp.]